MPKTSLDRRKTSAKSAVERTAMLTGKTFAGKYRLKAVIMSDFAGTLYKAENIVAGTELAVKVLRKGFLLTSDAVKRIQHPNISKVSRVLKEKDGTTAVVMDIPPGTSVRTILSKSQKMTPGEAVSVALQVLSGLHSVHSKRVVVQNLSSESVYFKKESAGDLAVKVSNVGLADRRKLPDNPAFLSPEVILGGAEPDKRSDIWSVGVLLFEMLFRRRPFSGKNQDELVGNILLRDPCFPELPGDVPEGIVVIIKKALEKEPENRYQNVTTMIGDLLPLQEELEETLGEEIEEALRKSLAPPPRPVPRPGAKTQTQVLGKIALRPGTPKRPVSRARPAVPGAKLARGPASAAKTMGMRSPVKPLKTAKPKEQTPRMKGTMQFSADMINPAISAGGQARGAPPSEKTPAKTQVLTSRGKKPPEDKVRENARSRPMPQIVDTKPKAKAPVAAPRIETADKTEDSNTALGATVRQESPIQAVSANEAGGEVTDDLITTDIQFDGEQDGITEPTAKDVSEDSTIDIEAEFADKPLVATGKEWLAKGWKLALVIGVAIGAYLPKVKALTSKSWRWMTDRGQAFAARAFRVKGFPPKRKEQQAISGMTLSVKGSRMKGWVFAGRKRGVAVLGAIAAFVPKVTPWVSNHRRVVAIVGGVVALLLLVIVVVSLSTGSDEPSPGARQASVMPETRSGAKPAAAQPTDEEPAIQPPVQPKPNTVSVALQGMPSGAQVMVAGAEVSLPLALPLSADSVDISVTAKGYKPFVDSVVPDRDQQIDVVMEKEEPIQESASVESRPSEKKKVAKKRRTGKRKRRARRARADKSMSKPQVNRGKLASNPFGG